MPRLKRRIAHCKKAGLASARKQQLRPYLERGPSPIRPAPPLYADVPSMLSALPVRKIKEIKIKSTLIYCKSRKLSRLEMAIRFI